MEERVVPAVDVVTSTLDNGGAGTLRSIIAAANNGDTVTFDPSIAGGTISLTQGEIPLAQSLTIDGGTNNITINAQGKSRIFDQNTVGGPSETINNLALINGSAPGKTEPNPGIGGALFSGGPLTLTNDIFTSNNALGAGGAVFVPADISATNCQFNSNSSSSAQGGAIDSFGNITLDHTSFTSNTATNGNGGAVYSQASAPNFTMTLKNGCSFVNNQVTGTGVLMGGAVYCDANLSVSGGSFSTNSATYAGGAIQWVPDTATAGASLTLTNVNFDHNSAQQGGAVQSFVTGVTAGIYTVQVTGCLFAYNQNNGTSPQDAYGAGMFEYQSLSGTANESLTLTNSTFYQNTSDGYGGGLALEMNSAGTGSNTAVLTSLTIYQNQAANQGGGLWVSTSGQVQPQLRNSIVAGNSVENPPDQGPDVYSPATLIDLGFNLIGVAGVGSGNDNVGWSSNTRKGTPGNPRDPGLDPNGLAWNGGPTQTIKVLPSSFGAYRAGDPGLLGTTDQRGYNRIGFVTIGAYDPDAASTTST